MTPGFLPKFSAEENGIASTSIPSPPEISGIPPEYTSRSLQGTRVGIQFLSGVNMNLILEFQFDNNTLNRVGSVGYDSLVLGNPPFATKYFSLSVYAASTNQLLLSTKTYAGYLSVVVFYKQGNQYLLKTFPRTDVFGSGLIVCNLYQFANSGTSGYQELSISNIPILSNGESAVMLDDNKFAQPVAFSPESTFTDAFTRGNFSLCTTNSSRNCLTFIPPPIGPINPQQDVWVVLLPSGGPPLVFVAETPSFVVKPALINTFYSITNNTGYSGASQLIYESNGQYFSPLDLKQFQIDNGVPVNGVSYDINGYSSNIACVIYPSVCAEANLDVQIMTAISQYPTRTTYYYENSQDFTLQWIESMAEIQNPPLVQSVSYGAPDYDVPASYFLTFNIEAVKVTAFVYIILR